MARQAYNPTPTETPSGPPPQELDVHATPEAFGAQVGEATQKLGGTLEKAGQETFNTVAEIKQQQLATDALNRTTGLSQDIGAIEMKYRQLSGNNATAALPDVQKQITDTVNKYAATIQSPFEQRAFLRDAKIYVDRSLINIGLHAGEEGKRAHVDALQSGIKEEQSALVRNTQTGETPDYKRLIDRTAMLAHEQGLDKDSANVLLQKATGQVMHDMVLSRISVGDLAGAKRVYQDALKQNVPGTELPLLDADHQASLNYQLMVAQNRADSAADKAAAVARVGINHEFSAAAAIVDNGQSGMTALSGLTDARIDAAFPRNPEMAAEVKDRVHDLRQTSVFLSTIEGKSPDQLRQMLADVPKPDPNDPGTYQERLRVNNALQSALKRTDEALKTDPASYVLAHHPEYAPLLDAAQKNPAQFAPYAQAVLGAQDQMGVPTEMQHVLPAPMAAAVAQKIEANPETAPATIKAMQQQYGQAWPNVWRDLSTLGKMPIAYQAVGTLDDERDGALLARWLGEAKKSQKTADDFLGPKPVADIKNAVRADPGVLALTASLSRSGSSNAQVDGILTAIDSLAFAKAFYDHDPRAALNAAQSFTSKYEFMPEGGARVPAKVYDAVSANARLLLDRMKLDDIAVPSAYRQTDNFAQAKTAMKLTPQEEFLYQHHLDNLGGTGKVMQPDGSISTILQGSVERDGRTYNIPTVWDGKVLPPAEAEKRAAAQGWNKWPSYASEQEAERRYQAMHAYMDRDVGAFLNPGAPKADEYLDLLRSAPTWVTSPSSDALWLMDNGGRLVRDKAGQPVNVPFSAPAPALDLGVPLPAVQP